MFRVLTGDMQSQRDPLAGAVHLFWHPQCSALLSTCLSISPAVPAVIWGWVFADP